jgi:transcriptional antiterminator RfaH
MEQSQKKIKIPLFNSLVFIKINENSRDKIFDFIGLVRYLFWLGKPAIVLDSEIAVLKK